MSSTRDPTAREGGERAQKADFYQTPAWCVHRLLDTNLLPQGGEWLEPGAGRGAIIRAVHDYSAQETRGYVLKGEPGYRPTWTAVEQDPVFALELNLAKRPGVTVMPVDYMPWAINRRHSPALPIFDAAVGNPPFSRAMEFIEVTIPIAKVCAFLLRLNFLGSLKRHDFFRRRMPDVYILPNRPSFTGGPTDSIEYAWFCWRQEDLDRRVGRIAMLEITTPEDRRDRDETRLSMVEEPAK